MNSYPCKRPLVPLHDTPEQNEIWLAEARKLDVGNRLCEENIHHIAAIICTSGHLQRMAKNFAVDIPEILEGKALEIIKDAQEHWKNHAKAVLQDDEIAREVRLFRNRCHFAIALAELSGKMDIPTASAQLSICAELGVKKIVEFLLSGLQRQPVSAGAESNTQSESINIKNWVILGLGKLGAGELNYSSDIDLIVLHQYEPNSDVQACEKQARDYIALTRRMAKILSEDTKDGFGWRVDFRLRPDPAATPLSLSFEAAVSYYESTARSWERAAFIRARPIAGDIYLGQQFLGAISSFVWRRSFDYTVIDDLQVWLRHLAVPEGFFGFDVKLGQFGIRHVELLVHILQLLGGGRHPELRTPNTAAALNALVKLDWLEKTQADNLYQAYFHWRQIEHRLQYLRDTQTHKLPRDQHSMSSFARFCGMADESDLLAQIKNLQQLTGQAARHPIFDRMLSNAERQQGAVPHILDGAADQHLSIDWLASLGFQRPHDIRDIIDGWRSGRIPATRGERARHYLFRLLPELTANLAKASEPDAAFARFADLVAALPAGAQAFSLLAQHPQLASLITDILVKAPALINAISRRTDILDILLEPHFFAPLEGLDELAQTCPGIKSDEPVELFLDRLKRWAHEGRFRASIHLLQKISTASQSSRFFSDIAQLSVQAVALAASQDFQRRYGLIKDSSLHIVGLGRLGCQTMTARSDMDLLFIYEGTTDSASSGKRALGLSAYYIRLTQLIISWLGAASGEGSLYEVDTRLRPDGKSGPAAIHTSRLTYYYEKEAWPWEHIAFAKSRHLYSTHTKSQSDLISQLHQIKQQGPSLSDLAADIVKMRERLAQEVLSQKSSGLALKKRPGGFLDIEFLAMLKRQQIAHLPENSCPIAVLQAFLDQNPSAEMQACLTAAQELEAIQAYSQICLPRYLEAPDIDAPSPAYQALAEGTGFANVRALFTQIEENCNKIERLLQAELKSI